MKNLHYYLAFVLLLTCVQAVNAASTTDDNISAEESWMIKGEQQAINLLLTNASLYTAFQCDLFLPEGLTLARDEQSAPLISLSGTNAQSHLIESSTLSSGAIRIVAMSMSNVAFSDNAVASLTISASAEAVGQKTIEVKNVRLVTTDSRKELNAPSTTATVNVMEQRAVLTAKDYTRKYGEANPSFEITTEGPAVDGQPEIVCEATATSPVGTYPILVQQGTIRNTCVTYVAGTLTIEKAVLTVTAQNCSRPQGQENPAFILTYAGWKNGEDENVLLTKPTASTTATKDSPIGEYAIKVSGGDARNYTFEYVDGILTVAEPTGIAAVRPEADELTVFTIAGNRLTVKSLKELPQGIYIVNGRKLAVRR
ncbi:MAG: hypothetical protein IJ544_00265 [Prevotella sp.]|nr:hypothetical protein [Prevotella sp.]